MQDFKILHNLFQRIPNWIVFTVQGIDKCCHIISSSDVLSNSPRAWRQNHYQYDLKVGVCGEHGGDPRSVKFFANETNLSYASC